MSWANTYGAAVQPTEQEIASYVASPFWAEMNTFLQKSYAAAPTYSYSKCSAQPGWNVKYQKAGRSLCTLYPMQGFFIAMVVIGTKEAAGAALLKPLLSPPVQHVMQTASGMAGAKWLMIEVTNAQIASDVKQLIALRRKPVQA